MMKNREELNKLFEKHSFLLMVMIIGFLMFPFNELNKEMLLSVGEGNMDETLSFSLFIFGAIMSLVKLSLFFFATWLIIPLIIESAYWKVAKMKNDFSVWLLLNSKRVILFVAYLIPLAFSLVVILPSGREFLSQKMNILNDGNIFIASFFVALFFVYKVLSKPAEGRKND